VAQKALHERDARPLDGHGRYKDGEAHGLELIVGGERRPLCPPGRVLLQSGKFWRGYRMQQVRLPATGALNDVAMPHHRVLLVTAGSCDVRYISRGQSGKRRLSVGSLCFVTRRHVFSRIAWKSTQCQATVVDISDIDSEPSPIDAFGGTDALFDVFLGFKDEAAASLIRLMSAEIESGCATGAIHGEALSLALASRIASLCQSIPALSPQGTATLSQKRLLSIARYVENNLTGDLSIDALAKVATMSAFHFARCFKNTTGLTPHQFVTNQRISTAKAMLVSGKHAIRDIAMLVGFSSHSHFAAVYRRITGVTPRHSGGSSSR